MLHKLITSFLLIAFLFPLLEKGFHALEHEEEEHCAAYEETHLHEKHHDCQLCDYNLEPAQKNTIDFNIIPYSKIVSFEFFNVSFFVETSIYYFSLRAPPAIG